MILSEDYTFVHIPKTGGTSVTKALGGRSGRVSLHRPARLTEATAPAFCFVRNPFTWLVSAYEYNRTKEPDNAAEQAYQEVITKLGFKGWLIETEFFLKDDPLEVKAPLQRRDQSYWWKDCEHVGRFEDLKDDFGRITRRLGLDTRPLPHLNAGPRIDADAYHDCETRLMIEAYHMPTLTRFYDGGAYD